MKLKNLSLSIICSVCLLFTGCQQSNNIESPTILETSVSTLATSISITPAVATSTQTIEKDDDYFKIATKQQLADLEEGINFIDFKIRQSYIDPEIDKIYRVAYKKILDNEIPLVKELQTEDEKFFKDLWMINPGRIHEKILMYSEFDYDGIPELSTNGGVMYILKYIPEENAFTYSRENAYFRMIGNGQMYRHDGSHGHLDEEYFQYNPNNKEWESMIKFDDFGTTYVIELPSKNFDSWVDKETYDKYIVKLREMVESSPLERVTYDELFGEIN